MKKFKKRDYQPRMGFFPYVPTRPEWNQLPWEAAREIDSRVDRFVGHNESYFIFQVTGVCKVLVSK